LLVHIIETEYGQDKPKDYGDGINDPGDEPAYTEDDEFEIFRDGGMTPEQVADPA
jgi:hypothetical protein